MTVESDYKAFRSHHKKEIVSSATTPAKKLQQYMFTLIYKPGKEMILADTLSCAYLDHDLTSENLNEDLMFAVNSVINNFANIKPQAGSYTLSLCQ